MSSASGGGVVASAHGAIVFRDRVDARREHESINCTLTQKEMQRKFAAATGALRRVPLM